MPHFKFILIAILFIFFSSGSSSAQKLDSNLLKTAKKGQIEKVQSLLEQGADINTRDKKGRTALMFAAEKDHLDVVKFLIESGAKINILDKKSESALDKAKKKRRQKEIIMMLEFAKAQETNSINAYEEFLRKYPDSEHELWISNRIKELKDEKRQLLAEVSAQEAKLRAYEIGVTTFEQFSDDKWNAEDPWLGKIGIVAYNKEEDSREYILGIQPLIDRHRAKAASEDYGFVSGLSLFMGGRFTQMVRASRSNPAILTKVVCKLIFEDDTGRLVSKECNFDH